MCVCVRDSVVVDVQHRHKNKPAAHLPSSAGMFERLTGSIWNAMFASHTPPVTTVSFSSDKYISVEAEWVFFLVFFFFLTW